MFRGELSRSRRLSKAGRGSAFGPSRALRPRTAKRQRGPTSKGACCTMVLPWTVAAVPLSLLGLAVGPLAGKDCGCSVAGAPLDEALAPPCRAPGLRLAPSSASRLQAATRKTTGTCCARACAAATCAGGRLAAVAALSPAKISRAVVSLCIAVCMRAEWGPCVGSEGERLQGCTGGANQNPTERPTDAANNCCNRRACAG